MLESFDEAVKDVFDGATIPIGGFGAAGGAPRYLIRAMANQRAKKPRLIESANLKVIEPM